jgi:uncharacterized protein (DUF2235 family)
MIKESSIDPSAGRMASLRMTIKLKELQFQEGGSTVKRIVICADGTWNRPDQKDRGKLKPSNVVKMSRAIQPKAQDGTQQVVYYDEGVGTEWGLLGPIIGGAFGFGLDKNIMECYRFIALNYDEGDELYLFGFSRGAFTVRSLAGFINRVGLLSKNEIYILDGAFDLYRKYTNGDNDETREFRKNHRTTTIKIKLVGVWDTVGALGIPVGLFRNFNRKKYKFHDAELGANVENGYHALAIDERRKPFAATLWENHAPGTHVEQVWFAGVHTNIGGGFDPDGLANCPFQWMAEKAASHGLELNPDFMKFYKAHPEGELRNSFTFPYNVFWKPYPRQIGKAINGHESVSKYALDRMKMDVPKENGGPYHPKNLVEYLEELGERY